MVQPVRQMFMIRLCSDRAAYEAVPTRKVTVDIAALRRSLEGAHEYEVTLFTPQFMVVKRKDAVEVTIVDDGRMIIRNVRDENAASAIVDRILPSYVVRGC